MIYFITDGEYVKIGTAKCLLNRFSSLQGSNPRNLYIVATIDGSYTEETELHKKFAHIRYKREWFYFTEELRTYIKSIKQMDETIIATISAINLYNRLDDKCKKAMLAMYKIKLPGFYFKFTKDNNKLEFSLPFKFLNPDHYKDKTVD